MEVNPANPGRNADPQDETDDSPRRAQGRSFGGEKSVQQAIGCAQRLHDREIAPAIENPSHQSGEDAQRCGQNDEGRRR